MPREKNPTGDSAKKRTPRKTPIRTALKKAVSKLAPGIVPTFVDPEQRAALIALAAYYRAEKRGFAPGGEVEDWQAAAKEVDATLCERRRQPGSSNSV